MAIHTVETQKPATRPQQAISDTSVRSALRLLLTEYHYHPDVVTVIQLEDVAVKLSAAAGKTPPWGWRYLRNVLNGKIDASVRLVNAIMALGATFDNVPLVWSTARPVQVYAAGNVKPGTLIDKDSRDCAYCQRPFIAHSWNDLCCSAECDRGRHDKAKNSQH